jgi:hypothetical protein
MTAQTPARRPASKAKIPPKKSSKTSSVYPSVSGKVEQVYPYCGGAKPSEEMLAEIRKPSPLSGKKFYVRQGNVNTTTAKIVASFTTDEKGEFRFTVAPGTYSIITEEQLNTIDPADYEKPGLKVDRDCMKKWWSKPYHVLVVKKGGISNLKFTIYHKCFIPYDIPCIQYTGPKPQ